MARQLLSIFLYQNMIIISIGLFMLLISCKDSNYKKSNLVFHNDNQPFSNYYESKLNEIDTNLVVYVFDKNNDSVFWNSSQDLIYINDNKLNQRIDYEYSDTIVFGYHNKIIKLYFEDDKFIKYKIISEYKGKPIKKIEKINLNCIVKDYKGNSVNLPNVIINSKYESSYYIISLWAYYCTLCLDNILFEKEHSTEFEKLGYKIIHLNESSINNECLDFLTRKKINYKDNFFNVDIDLRDKFNSNGLPYFILFDSKGNYLRNIGNSVSSEILKSIKLK